MAEALLGPDPRRGAMLATQVTSTSRTRAHSQVRRAPRRLVRKKYLRTIAEVVNFKPEHSRCVGQNDILVVHTG